MLLLALFAMGIMYAQAYLYVCILVSQWQHELRSAVHD